MVKIQKDVFWKAAIITVIVFLFGVGLGYSLENSRIDDVRDEYQNIELQWADAKLQSLYYQFLSPESCDAAIQENLRFSDKVYVEGLKLERYENANQLLNKMTYEKRKYALLKVEFWLNSVNLKEKCGADYVNLLYFYINDPEIVSKSEQDTQSVILKTLKDEMGSKLMLIPLPFDMDIATINIIKNTYNITTTPTILINEKIRLEGLQSLEDLRQNL